MADEQSVVLNRNHVQRRRSDAERPRSVDDLDLMVTVVVPTVPTLPTKGFPDQVRYGAPICGEGGPDRPWHVPSVAQASSPLYLSR